MMSAAVARRIVIVLPAVATGKRTPSPAPVFESVIIDTPAVNVLASDC